MTLAVLGAALDPHVVNWGWIIIAIVLGFAVGWPLSWVPLTAVPQRTALSHAFGGLAAGLLGTAKFYDWLYADPAKLTLVHDDGDRRRGDSGLSHLHRQLDGGGQAARDQVDSAATGDLQVSEPEQSVLLALAVLCGFGSLGIRAIPHQIAAALLFPLIILLALAFGVLLIIPIGGADMPTVISLLNSYAGPVRRGAGLCAQQQAAGDGRGARWLHRA